MSEKKAPERGKRFVGRAEDVVITRRAGRQLSGAVPVMALAQLRRSRGITQEELAGRLGVKQTQISRLERRDDFRFATFRAYLRALGVETAQLEVHFTDGTSRGLSLQITDEAA